VDKSQTLDFNYEQSFDLILQKEQLQ
jgi:hypothetical protein